MDNFLYRNPWVRALIPLVLIAITGVTSSSLVVEIASGTTINWLEMPKKLSFHILIISILSTCIYQVLVIKNDNKILKELTPQQFEAILRNEVIHDAANEVRRLIKKGNVQELKKTTESFKELFGERVQ